MAAMLLVSSVMLATPALADNPLSEWNPYANVIITSGETPPTTEPAAPPPPPAPPAVTIPPTTTLAAPTVTTTPGITGYPPPPPPTDNTFPPRPYPPYPRPPRPPYPYPWIGIPDYYNNWAYNYPYYYQYSSSYYYPSGPLPHAYPVYYEPVINSFTANPDYIQAGQLATLSWNVSNADLISISPSVGSVAASGSFAVIPTYTTTYTITATSSRGSVSASTTVTVAAYAASYYDTYGTGNSASSIYTAPVAAAPVAAPVAAAVTTSGVSSSSMPASNPWLMYSILIGLLAVAAAVIITLLVKKPAVAHVGAHTIGGTGTTSHATAPASTMPATSSAVTSPVETTLPAKFVSPGGTTMPVTGKPLGRRDFQALVSPEKSDIISRQHILVTYDNSQYFIEDLNSTNGTKLNGSEIRGTGKHAIANGDTVELAGALNLTFKV